MVELWSVWECVSRGPDLLLLDSASLTHPASILQADTLLLNSEKMEEKVRFFGV